MAVLPYLYEDPSLIARRLLGAGVTAEDLIAEPGAVRSGSRLLQAAVSEGKLELPDDLLEAVVAYHAAAALAAKSGSPRLVRALVEATGAHAWGSLERSAPEEIARAARMLGVPVERSKVSIPWLVERGRIVPLPLEYSVPLAPYLRLAAGAGGELSLPNSFLRGGRVYLDKHRLLRLTVRAAMVRAASIIDKYRGSDLGREIAEEAMRLAARVEAGEARGGLDWGSLPGCLRRIVEEGASTDEEAYMLVSFLASVRPSRESIERALLRSGLAGARALENLADAILALKGYTPYKCSSEPGLRACPEGCEGEGPVSEYYRRRSARRGRGPGRGARRGR